MSSATLPLITLLQVAAESTARGAITVEHSWLDTLANIAQSMVSVLLTVMIIVGVALLFALKRSVDELTKLIKQSYAPMADTIREAREVTGEVRTLVKSVAAPLTRITETVGDANDRARSAMLRAEDRLERLDALVGIVQDEVEDMVARTASLVSGFRAGGSVLRQSLGLRRRRGGAHRPGRAEGRAVTDADLESDAAEAPRIRPRRAPTP